MYRICIHCMGWNTLYRHLYTALWSSIMVMDVKSTKKYLFFQAYNRLVMVLPNWADNLLIIHRPNNPYWLAAGFHRPCFRRFSHAYNVFTRTWAIRSFFPPRLFPPPRVKWLRNMYDNYVYHTDRHTSSHSVALFSSISPGALKPVEKDFSS